MFAASLRWGLSNGRLKMATAGSITISLLAATGSFETDMQRAQKRLAGLGNEADKTAAQIAKAAAGVAAFAATSVTAMAAMAAQTAKSAKEVQNFSAVAGATTAEFQRIAVAAQSVGLSQEKVSDQLKDFNEKVGEFLRSGGGGMKDFFEQVAPKIGLTADAFRNLSGPQGLQLYYNALEKAGLNQQEMSFYLESMASDTTALIPILRNGGAELERLADRAQRFGVILSAEAIGAAERFIENIDALSQSATGLKNEVASALLPTLNSITDALVEMAEGVGPIGGKVETALKVAGAAASAAAVIFTSRLLASITSSGVAFAAATIEAGRYQVALARMAGVSTAAAAGIGAMSAAARAGSAVMAVLGGPVGLLATIGLTGAAFISMGRDADQASMDLDGLAQSFRTLSQEKLDLRRFDLEDEVKLLEDRARESGQILQGLENDVAALYERAAQGANITAEELENARRALLEQRDAHDTNSMALDRARTLLDQVVQHLNNLRGASLGAAGATNALNQAMFSEAGEKYLATIQGRIKALQDAGDPIKIASRYIAEHADLTETDRVAIMSAAHAEKALIAARDAATRSTKSSSSTINESKRAAESFRKEQERSLAAQYQSVSAIHEQAQGLEDQVALYGLSATAIEDLTIARLEEQAAILSMYGDKAQPAVDAINAEIEARKRLRTAIGSHEAKEAEKASRDDWASSVEQVFQQVGQSLTDQLFEGGKSGRDLVKDLFKTLTLRVLVQPVMGALQSQVTNSLGGVFGKTNPSQQQSGSFDLNSFLGTGAGNSITTMGSVLGSQAMTQFGAGLTAGAQGVLSDAGATALMNIGTEGSASFAAGSAAGSLPMGSILGYGSAIYNMTQGQYGSAAGAAIGTAIMPGIGTVVGSMLGSFLDGSFGGESRHGGSYNWTPDAGTVRGKWDDGDPGAEANKLIGGILDQAVATINSAFEGVGSQAALSYFMGWAESSEKGRGGTASGGRLAVNGNEYAFGTTRKGQGYGDTSGDLGQMIENMTVDIYQTIIQAWQLGIDEFPTMIQDMLRGIDADSLGAEQAQALAAQIQAIIQQVSAFQAAVEQLPFENLKQLSFDAAAGLIAAAGGLENLNAGMTSYYQNFYSQQEQLDFAARQMGASFEALGLTMPDVEQGADAAKAAYRALVESLDPTTEAGQQATATLYALSGGFAELVTGLDELNGALVETARTAADIARERTGLGNQILQMTGNTAALRSRELGAIDESNRWLQEHIWALEDQARAAQEASEGLQTAFSTLTEVAQREIATLRESFGATDSAMSAYRTSVQRLESEIGSLLSTIGKGVSDLRGEVAASALMQYNQARAVISTSLLTGQLPQTADLGEVLRAAQQGVAAQQYSSLFEQQKAYLTLANEMEALQDIAKPELDAAQATLEQLEKQYGLLRGISDTGEQSLTALAQQARSAIAAEEIARSQISVIESQLEAAQSQYNALMGIDGTLATGFASVVAALAAFEKAAQTVKDVAAGGGSGSSLTRGQQYIVNNPDLLDAYLTDPEYAAMGADGFASWHWEKYGKNEAGTPGRASYDVGTPYVPYDMLANVHKGEIIVNPQDSDILRRTGIRIQAQGGMSQDVVVELRQLREDNKKVTAYLYQITKETKRTALNTEDTATAVGAHGQSEGAVVVY